MITPQSDVYLLKVPLEINDLNQLTFANKTAQYNYFSNLPKIEFDNFTYQRKDNIIRVPALYDDIIDYNYVMYRNDAYSNKWFYAYITHMEYLNDNVTAVTISSDSWQSWQFDLNYKPVFVEREHTNDDTIGSNTVPENVECGEPVINGEITHITPYTQDASGIFITFMVSDKAPLPLNMQNIESNYNGIFSGYTLFGVKTFSEAAKVVDRYVKTTSSQGAGGTYADAIKNIFIVPEILYNIPTEYITDLGFTAYTPLAGSSPVNIKTATIARLNTLDSYQPKNNKLYTWPYSYLIVSNNVGGNAEYRYEDFNNNTASFDMAGIISSGCDIKLNPTQYKHVTEANQIYGLKMSKLPVCSWNTDSYAIWLAQNQLNMQVSLTRNTLKTVAGVATKNPELIGSGIGSYAGDLINSMSESYIAKHVPDEVHGDTNGSDYNYSANLYFDVRRMCVRGEYARIIDDYFSAVGYATNRVKIPNITGRRNWNYVKTVGCYIQADIPQEDLQQIKSMFDKGVTFWHNPATFADYSQNNDII